MTNPGKENSITALALRVSLEEKEGAAPYLGLSFDEEKPEDESFSIQGVTFIVDKILLRRCGNINIDFIEEEGGAGFKITPSNPYFTGHYC